MFKNFKVLLETNKYLNKYYLIITVCLIVSLSLIIAHLLEDKKCSSKELTLPWKRFRRN